MKSTQAWGWLAAGVVALGLNGIYHDGGAEWARRAVSPVIDRIAERAEPVIALAAGRADWLANKADMVVAQNETASCRWATSLARLQTKIARMQSGMARFEAMSAREEATLARMEANRARVAAQVEAQVARVRVIPAAFNPMACPRVRVRTNIPGVRVAVPVVSVSAGPA